MNDVVLGSETVRIIDIAIWPVVVVIGLLVLLVSARAQTMTALVAARFSKVEAFGIRVELTEKSARETRQSIDDAFAILRRRINREFDSAARYLQIDDSLAAIYDLILPTIVAQNKGRTDLAIRSTIYVRDALFNTSLNQLVDYYPKASGPRGRTISQRFGIAGKAWRTELPEVEGDEDPDPRERVQSWGMTKAEATAGGSSRSFLAVPVFNRSIRVAVLYFDAHDPRIFDDETTHDKRNAIVSAVTGAIDRVELAKDLAQLNQEVQLRAPGINIGE